jgi:PAS domain S-box-containing protein
MDPTHLPGSGELRFRRLLDTMPVCIFVANIASLPAVIVQANRRAALVYGYTSAEWVGLAVDALAPADSIPTLLGVVQQVQQGQTVTCEMEASHRDGTRFPVRVTGAPDPDEGRLMIAIVEEIAAERHRRNEAEAIDAERRRIAHEIHDGVAQRLAGLRLKSALWSHQAVDAPPAMRAALGEMLEVLTQAIADLRRAIYALRPLDLEALGFLPALTQLVAEFGDQNGLAVRLDIVGEWGKATPAWELPLYRMVQEGLNNVGRHAAASAVVVRLEVDEAGGVTVSLTDNGRGFEPQRLDAMGSSAHYGLRQMRERVMELGGALDIHSAPGEGAQLVISLPPVAAGAAQAALAHEDA